MGAVGDKCPFCLPATGRLAFVGPLTKGIWDAFPVTEGHLLLVPHRHVAAWAELAAEEQAELVADIGRAQSLLQEKFAPDGFNVGFNEGEAGGQTIPHFHIHVIPRRNGDMPDPRGGVRHVIPTKGNYLATAPVEPAKSIIGLPHDRSLIAGDEDELLLHLVPYIDGAIAVDLAVAFVMDSGVRILVPHLQDLLKRGGRLRLVAGDYLDVTDPQALRQLMDLEGEASLYVFETLKASFHPKTWVFRFSSDDGVAIVGSSNLSASALRSGIEWNGRITAGGLSGGWRDVSAGFETLLGRPEIKVLTYEWIEKYEARRRAPSRQSLAVIGSADEEPLPPPVPHAVQLSALDALAKTRLKGYSAGLVVLATGLGKTWLSAFDSSSAEFKSVLFVAHREEILAQAIASFRRIRPNAKFGRFTGTEKDTDAEVLFASVQSIGRVANLRQFSPDTFDYIVVDEFHHASARTYRNLISYFSPKFLLGLTATPERMDGGDLLGLCQENLVFRCDISEGIERGLLSQFRYFGVPDLVDYKNIPWRSLSFDELALTTALATNARAQNALEQYEKHGGSKTLAFCCSRAHADFMAEFFRSNGRRAVAVHSGESSAPRSTSLEALAQGELDVIFAVDIFNEGVDLPAIDTVLMLRPTESVTVWTQQFGRGLRKSPEKDRLNVIDYIGNHRIFLTKVRALLAIGDGDRAVALALERLQRGEVSLPPGCEVTYELESINILREMLRPTDSGDAIEAFYVDFRLRHGVRPLAIEAFHAGYDPHRTGHGGWFSFVRHMGDLTSSEAKSVFNHQHFLDGLERTQMSRSYKMLLLQAMLRLRKLPGAIETDRLAAEFALLASRNPIYSDDISVDPNDLSAVEALITKHPINAWVSERSMPGGPYFAVSEGKFLSTFEVDPEHRSEFITQVEEVVDWRLAEYLNRPHQAGGLAEGKEPTEFENVEGVGEVIPSNNAVIWRDYMREEIPVLFGLSFSTAIWNQGFVIRGKDVFLLVTLKKNHLHESQRYEDSFVSPTQFSWQSQNRTTRASNHGQIISGATPGYRIHLFVRAGKLLPAGRSAPFTYCGRVHFQSWEGNSPITVAWSLEQPVPQHLRRLFNVPT